MEFDQIVASSIESVKMKKTEAKRKVVNLSKRKKSQSKKEIVILVAVIIALVILVDAPHPYEVGSLILPQSHSGCHLLAHKKIEKYCCWSDHYSYSRKNRKHFSSIDRRTLQTRRVNQMEFTIADGEQT